MKLRKILAGIMAFVFSLNLIQINVNAEAISEETKEEKVVVSKEETTETNTTKEVVVKIVEKSANGISTVAKLAFSGIKSLLRLIGVGIKYVAMGACMTVGGIMVIYAPEYVPDMIDAVKDKFQSKSKPESDAFRYY